jgi:hypothetical protein
VISNCPDGATTCFIGDGGTSASSPIWAGISRLVAQSLNTTRLGNMNPQLYQLAANGSAALVDVSQAGNNCTFDTCSAYPGYLVGAGYDLGTGLGSPNIQNLIAAFQPSPAASATPTATSSAAPTPTPVGPTPSPTPGAQAVGSNTLSDGHAGQTVSGGSLKITNISKSTETISTVTLSLSNPGLFSGLTMNAEANGGAVQTAVTGTLGSNTIFTFSPPLAVAAGAVAQFTISATISQSAARIDNAVIYASMLPAGVSRGALPNAAGFILLVLGLVSIPTDRRRRAMVIAGLMMLLIATQIGCGGGSSNSGPTVLNSSQQQVPAGGIGAVNAQGATVQVQGLPVTMSTIRLVS